MERVCEAMWLSVWGAEVEAWDRGRWATGPSVGDKGGGTLGVWRPLGVGILYVGSRIGGPGKMEVVLGGAVGGRAVGGGGDTHGDRRGATLGVGC